MNNEKPEQLGLSAKQTAVLLGISQRHLWKLHAGERVPEPIKLGRIVRWNRAELLAWMDAGAPSRDEWEARKGRAAN